MSAGYSGKPLPDKLGLRSGMAFTVLTGPPDVEDILGPLPDRLSVTTRLAGHRDAVLFFVTRRRRLEARIPALTRAVAPDGMIWVAWPKRGADIATDITENVIREVALPTGLVDVKVCALDERWSGLKLVIRKALR